MMMLQKLWNKLFVFNGNNWDANILEMRKYLSQSTEPLMSPVANAHQTDLEIYLKILHVGQMVAILDTILD